MHKSGISTTAEFTCYFFDFDENCKYVRTSIRLTGCFPNFSFNIGAFSATIKALFFKNFAWWALFVNQYQFCGQCFKVTNLPECQTLVLSLYFYPDRFSFVWLLQAWAKSCRSCFCGFGFYLWMEKKREKQQQKLTFLSELNVITFSWISLREILETLHDGTSMAHCA